ncbi:hypothetical protein [Planococcus beigongshangi]|nr:hypothetical protein [Planococcus beigongshangi]
MVGSTRPEHIKEDLQAMQANIPAAFWEELVEEKLVSPKAILPES